MKPYGVKRKDIGCCPGHDKYTKHKNERKTKTRLRAAKKKERKVKEERISAWDHDMEGWTTIYNSAHDPLYKRK